MLDDRHRVAQDSPAALARRVRAWLGFSGSPPPPRPSRLRIDPLRRSWLGAFWQARVSVVAGVSLDDYLRSRLARYLAALPVPRSRLGVDVAVEDGALRIRTVEPEPQAQPPTASDAWLARLVAAEGPAVRDEAAALEARLAALEDEDDAARVRTEALERRLAADVASGAIAGPAIEASAEQMGRPGGRSILPEAALLTFAGVALAAETWQVAAPLLRTSGLDTQHLRAELAARPLDVVFAALFAVGVTTGLFAFVHATLGAAEALSRGPAEPRRRGWLSAAAASSAVLGAIVAAAVVALPGESSATPGWADVVLMLAVPMGASLVVRAAGEGRARRLAAEAAALAWDRERASALADRARRLEELDWAEEERREIEAERELVRRRLQELASRALQVSRRFGEAERRERADLARLGQSLVGALELDRYEFVRQASARGAPELISPRHRPPGDPRPAAGSPPPRPVDLGRLAS